MQLFKMFLHSFLRDIGGECYAFWCPCVFMLIRRKWKEAAPLPSTFFTPPPHCGVLWRGGGSGVFGPSEWPPSLFCAIVIMGARHATDLGGQFFPLFSEGSFFLCSLFLASFYVLSLIKTRKKMENKSLGLQQRSPTQRLYIVHRPKSKHVSIFTLCFLISPPFTRRRAVAVVYFPFPFFYRR